MPCLEERLLHLEQAVQRSLHRPVGAVHPAQRLGHRGQLVDDRRLAPVRHDRHPVPVHLLELPEDDVGQPQQAVELLLPRLPAAELGGSLADPYVSLVDHLRATYFPCFTVGAQAPKSVGRFQGRIPPGGGRPAPL